MSSSVHTKIQREFAEVERELEEDGARGSPLFSGGIIDFCKGWLKLAPTQYQEKILLDASRFVVARWARQTGKSTTIAALSLYCALHEGAKRVIILAPSLRQSKKLIHRIGSFIPRIALTFSPGDGSRPDWSLSTAPASRHCRTVPRR